MCVCVCNNTFLVFNADGAPSRAFDNQMSKLFAKVRIDWVSEFGIGLKTYDENTMIKPKQQNI